GSSIRRRWRRAPATRRSTGSRCRAACAACGRAASRSADGWPADPPAKKRKTPPARGGVPVLAAAREDGAELAPGHADTGLDGTRQGASLRIGEAALPARTPAPAHRLRALPVV